MLIPTTKKHCAYRKTDLQLALLSLMQFAHGLQSRTTSPAFLALGESPLEVNGVLLQVGSRRGCFKPANDKIIACSQHLKQPGSKLSDNEKNQVRKVASSFVSGSEVCSNTGEPFTDQDCVSYVYHRTLERIKGNKFRDKKKE